jgi:D-methionine transport system substrate-binding protein
MGKVQKIRAAVSLAAALGLFAASAYAAGKADKKAAQSAGRKTADGRTLLRVQADAAPHAELLEFVKPKLAAQGISLEIAAVTDRAQANAQTASGEFDANFFQHEPYLQSVVAEKGYDLVSGGAVHVEPIGAYSDKYRAKAELPDRAKIAIPSDATNEYRALRVLEREGFIRLKPGADALQTTVGNAVAAYLKPVALAELDFALIPLAKANFDAYITNTSTILEAGIDPASALFREGRDSPYANILAVKAGRKDDPALKVLYQALTGEDVRRFIEDRYKGAVIPAF